ncbi:MAG: PEP-CTERM sorting domain-containing protein [Spirulina sp.]
MKKLFAIPACVIVGASCLFAGEALAGSQIVAVVEVPEPSTILGVLTLGTIGAYIIKHNQQSQD